jgi:pilus assembly protein Flp/PilA
MMKLYFSATNRISAAAGKLFKREEGASLVEYGLLVGLIAVVCIAAITLTGTNIKELFERVAAKLTGVAP